MPVCIGMMGDQNVAVLRDMGCCAVVIKSNLVNNDQMTGRTETCIIIDGTVRRVEDAEIEIETPYYTGQVKAVCIQNPLYDVIIGNVPCVIDDTNDKTETQAVVTRSQAKKEAKPVNHLKSLKIWEMM